MKELILTHKAERDILIRGEYIPREAFLHAGKEGLKIAELVQVCYDISKEKVKDKEIKSLLKTSKILAVDKLTFITWDYENEEHLQDKKINFVPLWKWLLMVS